MTLGPFPGQVPWADIADLKKGLPSQTFKQYLSALDGIVRSIVSSGGLPRIVLSSATKFFVDNTSGNDANNGLTAATAWKTLAHAIAVLTGLYDFGGQIVTLQFTGGTGFTTQLLLSAWVGGGSLVVDLGGGSIALTGGIFPANDAISHISGSLTGDVTIQNGTLSASSGTAIRNTAPGIVKIGTNLTFAASAVHMIAGGGGTIELTNGYTLSGGGAFHWFTDVLGQITDRGATKVVTISGSPTFSTFANAVDAGTIIMIALTFSPATAAFTGARFSATGNGIINSGGRGINFIPGSAAGSTGTGGQYL